MKLFELFDRTEATYVANELVSMFAKLGFTIELDGHTIDRLLGRDKLLITKEQMLDTFQYLILTKKRDFRPMRNKVASMIVNDNHNDGNYILNFRDNHIIITTAMKKKNFKSSNDRQGSVKVKLGTHASRAAPDAGTKSEEELSQQDTAQSDADVMSTAENETRNASSGKVWPRS